MLKKIKILFFLSTFLLMIPFSLVLGGSLKDDVGNVYWYHIYPPGGTYHGHLIGDAAYSATWLDEVTHGNEGQVLMGGSIGTKSWYCEGNWYSEPHSYKFTITVVQIKDETTGITYSGSDIIGCVQFQHSHKRPHGSNYIDTIINLLWSIVQYKTGFSWPNPFKFSSSTSGISDSYDSVSATLYSDMGELRTKPYLWVGAKDWLVSSHTYTIKLKLTWRFTWTICGPDELQSIDPISQQRSIEPLGQPVATKTITVYRYISYKVKPSGG